MRPVSQPISKGDDEMTKDLTKYVTTRQAAEMMGVVTDHVYRLIEGDKLRSIRLGHEWLIYVPSIEKYQQTKSKRGRPPSGSSKTLEKDNGQG
jgi:excisionase family DNA binding protein